MTFNKIMEKLKTLYYNYKCPDIESPYEFIWGIMSYYDLTSNEACEHTLNDIDIMRKKDNGKYIIGIETIYTFRNGFEGEKYYMSHLLNKFTEWMNQNNYNTELSVHLYDVFTYKDINSEFDSIEELYTYFKMLVTGFISQK